MQTVFQITTTITIGKLVDHQCVWHGGDEGCRVCGRPLPNEARTINSSREIPGRFPGDSYTHTPQDDIDMAIQSAAA